MPTLCACGCGRPTSIAAQTDRRLGHIKGQPVRYIAGHNNQKADVDYRPVYVDGRVVKIHRLRAERALGKPLPPGAEVHHADGSKSDTAPLVICQDSAYHKLLHARMRVKAAGGNPNTQVLCATCRQPKAFADFGKLRRGQRGLQPSCRACRRRGGVRQQQGAPS